MEKPSVYIETTIVSYITARPSRDPYLLGCQRLTRQWWRKRRGDFRLFTSQFARDEAARGEPLMARRRLVLLGSLGRLEAAEEVNRLAKAIMAKVPIPLKASEDAAHIAKIGRAHV